MSPSCATSSAAKAGWPGPAAQGLGRLKPGDVVADVRSRGRYLELEIE